MAEKIIGMKHGNNPPARLHLQPLHTYTDGNYSSGVSSIRSRSCCLEKINVGIKNMCIDLYTSNTTLTWLICYGQTWSWSDGLNSLPKICFLWSLPAMKSLATSTRLRPSVRLLWTCKSIKQFRCHWDIVERKYVFIRHTALNDRSLSVFVAGITSSSLTSLLTWDSSSNWPGVQLRKKVRISDTVTSPSVWKFWKKFPNVLEEEGSQNQSHKRENKVQLFYIRLWSCSLEEECLNFSIHLVTRLINAICYAWSNKVKCPQNKWHDSVLSLWYER